MGRGTGTGRNRELRVVIQYPTKELEMTVGTAHYPFEAWGPFSVLFLSWTIVDLHYCVNFRCISQWFSDLYIFICANMLCAQSCHFLLQIIFLTWGSPMYTYMCVCVCMCVCAYVFKYMCIDYYKILSIIPCAIYIVGPCLLSIFYILVC